MDRRRRRWLIAFTLVFLVTVAFSSVSCGPIYGLYCRAKIKSCMKETAQFDQARLEQHEGIPVLHLYGTHQQMGRQYGTLLGRPLRYMHGYIHGFLSQKTIDAFLAFATDHESCLPPELREEMRAAAEAAEVPYEELVAMNVIPRLSCSMLAVTGPASADGRMIVGRNAEYSAFGLEDRAGLVVVYHPVTGPAVASVTFLGLIASFTGMNSEGVCYGNMLVFNAADDELSDEGLPVQIALRMAAHRNTNARTMIDSLRVQKAMIPMIVMAADAKEARVAELGLTGSAVRQGQNGVLASSNWFRTPALAPSTANCPRYDTLLRRAGEGRMDVPSMQAALHAASIEELNIQAVVFEPEARRMHVSLNRVPASKGPFITLDRRTLFGNT